jgi:hypothetical protein
MSKELKTTFTSGSAIYALIVSAAGQLWRTDTLVFENPLTANWTNYAITITEQSTTGIYEGDFPTAIVTAGTYYVLFRQRAGASPASTDLPSGMFGGTIYWSGTAELSPVSTAGPGSGNGPIAINQNTGGTDNLRYVDSTGNGVEDANVMIYLATDWPTQPTRVQANATTGADGRWLSPAFVQSGTYVAVFAKIGADGPDVSPAFTV